MVRCRYFHHYLVREITRKYLNKDRTEYGVCSFRKDFSMFVCIKHLGRVVEYFYQVKKNVLQINTKL